MLSLFSIFYFIPFLVTLISATYLFPEHAIVLPSQGQLEKSYFGFSVQLQSAPNSDGRVIVGAPKSSDNVHPDLIEAGAVFLCSLDAKTNCEQYEMYTGESDFEYIRGLNYSCLGYSLDADENIDGRLVTCAPRWVNYKNKQYSIPKLNGMCFHVKNGRNNHNIQKLMPLELSDLQFDGYDYNYILGEAGFSSHLVQDSETVAFTALGLRNWTGSVVQYNEAREKDGKHFVVVPKNIAKLETYSYFGYSLSSGRFNSSDPNKIFYVSGAPRSDNLTGTVYMYEQLTNNQVATKRYEFPGKQFGEYFGASLAVADLNGDGIPDLVVGAPMHSTDEKDEIGCIYMYITKKYETGIKVTPRDKIVGEERGGRFGTALSSVGDINKDGCEDIVVGAPYFQERGAIFLYLGQKGEQPLKLDQIISASDCNPYLRGFGFSLSRGVDIDNNKYNDLAVGSYLSGQIVVLKSRPIVNITPSLKPSARQLDVSTKTFNLTSCIKYTTKDVPEVLSITTDLRVDKSQINFDNRQNSYSREYTYTKNIESCIDLTMTIQEGLMHDTKFTMSYKINQDSRTEFCKFCPIEEEHKPPIFRSIPFVSGCSETICKSNLKLSASFINTTSPVILGSKTEILIRVTVENLGENAFGTKLFMYISPFGTLVTHEKFCTESLNNITCDFIQTLTSNDKRQLMFILNHENLPINEKLLNVTLSVTSSSEDIDISDNTISLKLPLSTDVKYNIIKKSEPEQLLMTENITSAVNFNHRYSIESAGATELEIIDYYIYIPYMYKEHTVVDNISITNCNHRDNEEIVDAYYEIVSNEIDNKITNLNCSSTQTENLKCKKIKCDIRDAKKITSDEVEISLDFKISLFHDEANSVYFITSFESKSDYFSIKSYARTSLVAVPKAASLTLYIIIGVVVGLILIIIIALIFKRVGFFKRNKPPTQPEGETLLETNEEVENANKVEMNEEGTNFTKNDDITKDESDG